MSLPLFSVSLSYSIVPSLFEIGIIVPILKKPCLNPNHPENFRPITLSPVFTKMLQLIIMPPCPTDTNQFGFRKGCSTSFGCSMLNDVSAYYNSKGSPLYVCSLDAEKCFDSIWHPALFFKLMHKIPACYWVLLFRWYSNLQAYVKWNGSYSDRICVSKGVRQGSVLSPCLFNIFINDMLKELTMAKSGTCIGNIDLNNFAYADDITVFSATVAGLQHLINICVNYANTWRFTFNIKKSKCVILGKTHFYEQPAWSLGGAKLDIVENLDILGVVFSETQNSAQHVDKRTSKCRGAYYSLSEIGMSYPGLASDVKAYLWKLCVFDQSRIWNGCTVL